MGHRRQSTARATDGAKETNQTQSLLDPSSNPELFVLTKGEIEGANPPVPPFCEPEIVGCVGKFIRNALGGERGADVVLILPGVCQIAGSTNDCSALAIAAVEP